MITYGLGIDTGGTYTDSVILDMGTGRVIGSNKALTTRHDLSEGIRNSLNGLDLSLVGQVSLVSLSSTLATNSVVENKITSVGLITIGKEFGDPSRPAHYASIIGKFGMNGTEEVPLDIESAEKALENMKGHVEALAVAGYLSVRNPTHELRISELAEKILNVPVVCAHTLTSQLGFAQRTTTAVMNAGLIPIIRELLKSVGKVLTEFGVRAPLMIVKGDGSLMNSETALRKPVDTILSGPASSIMGAKAMTEVQDAFILDMGGTTVDIGILHNGMPRIDTEGASLGGRKTRVRAADVSAFGIGGDSRILVNGRKIILSQVHAIPLCIASSQWPAVKEVIRTLESITDDRSPEDFPLGDILQDSELFVMGNNPPSDDLAHHDISFLEMLSEGPLRAVDAGKRLGVPPHAFQLSKMEDRGNIIRIGFTPTDILHALGTYCGYDKEVSVIAAGYLARKCGMDTESFLEKASEEVVCRIASCVMEKAMSNENGTGELSQLDREIIERTLYGKAGNHSLHFRLHCPLIGIGAPVGAWLPKVSEKLGTELILPEYSSIGNALGAITGSVSETVTMSIRADSDELTDTVPCRVFTGTEIRRFDNQHDAIDFARSETLRLAEDAAIAAGAVEPLTEVTVTVNNADLCSGKTYFRGAEISARSTGKPRFA